MKPDTTVPVPGLTEDVDIIIDRYGVPHLQAASREDLYLAQGFNAARDRLFQMDLWRRRGLGRMAEVFGVDYVEQDRATRLFVFRGDIAQERQAYGHQTWAACRAFVRGVNEFIELTRCDQAWLPPEFSERGYLPARWETDDLFRIRCHGIHKNVEEEVARAITLRDHGPEVERLRRRLDPPGDVTVPDGLDLDVISEDVLATYRLGTAPLTGEPASGPGRAGPASVGGSNAWAVSPHRTATGRPLLASDPHRILTLPSLRYVSHLRCPSLDAIGAGEPVLPGVAIGHNGHVAFGLTIFAIDQEDLYVYETNPDDPNQYRYGDSWEAMRIVHERVGLPDGTFVDVELRFTRHGPVLHESPERDVAFALRAAWLDVGMAPYLGGLALLDATSCADYRASLRWWGTPGENHVVADADGQIAWQAAGRVPVRPNWDGLLPVPGDGRYEWAGFEDARQLPGVTDPEAGWFASANEHNLPATPTRGSVPSREWSAAYRWRRIAQELSANDACTMDAMTALQMDHVSLPAREVVGYLEHVHGVATNQAAVGDSLDLLRTWDGELGEVSSAAALFEVWYRRHLRPALLRDAVSAQVATASIESALASVSPTDHFDSDARIVLDILRALKEATGIEASNRFEQLVTSTLATARAEVERCLGPDPASWRWGDLHVVHLHHLATSLVGEDESWGQLGPVARGGSGDTVDAAPYLDDFRQGAGASFRMVVDVGAWKATAMSAPGQSGDPRSEHYGDLLIPWAGGESFPLLYRDEDIERHAVRRLRLTAVPVTEPGT
jgi:penicillin G amidase